MSLNAVSKHVKVLERARLVRRTRHGRGLFYHSVEHAGRTWAHYGRFIALERAKRIEHTWVSEATRGLESIVTVTLAAKGGDTEVALHHANVPDDEMGRQHADGGGSCSRRSRNGSADPRPSGVVGKSYLSK